MYCRTHHQRVLPECTELGFVVQMTDDQIQASIIHYGVIRGHRLSQSMIVAEVNSLVYEFEDIKVVCKAVEELLCSWFGIESSVEDRALFKAIGWDSTTSEHRLQIHSCWLRESYRNDEVMRAAGRSKTIMQLTYYKKVISKYTAMVNLEKNNAFENGHHRMGTKKRAYDAQEETFSFQSLYWHQALNSAKLGTSCFLTHRRILVVWTSALFDLSVFSAWLN